ncbi:hypothetical protein AAG570_002591 [Ranatra chinensis]|uniref:Cytochrome P450 n=1 Tax=Ranatra chinensis TaxID=642074 RepID=A0ABD0YA35_9HEMI
MIASNLATLKLLFLRVSIFDFIQSIYDRLEGSGIGGYFQGTTPVFMVRDVELINKILIKDFSHFHDHGFLVDTEVNPLEGHLFNMEGQKWRALRNKLSPTFTSGKLKWMLPQMSECADQLVQVLQKETHGEDVLIRDYLSRFSIDVISSCAFGLEGGALKDPDCEFRKMAKKIFRPSGIMRVKNTFRLFFPKTANWLKMKLIDPEVNDFFFNLTRQAFEHRLKTGLRRNDFVDLLLQLKQKGWVDYEPEEDEEKEEKDHVEVDPDTKLVLTDGLLAAQSFIFLIAGLENIAVSISLVLFLLSRHQDAQEKARQEVKRVAEKHRGHFSYDALKEMVYLECCITEALRLYPPAVGLFHHCTKDYLLEDGQTIKKGTTVIIPSYSMQRDPQYFQDPDEFQPERFLDDHNVPSNVYLPFGAGPRVCIGEKPSVCKEYFTSYYINYYLLITLHQLLHIVSYTGNG